MLTEQHVQEGLSRSFIQALSAAAGVNLIIEREFDYGIDGTFRPVSNRGNRRVETGFPLDFQLKASKRWSQKASNISYDLESKTYNDFVTRDPKGIGAVLILLCLPTKKEEWINFSEDRLKLSKCCYYFQPVGDSVPNEKSTKRVLIPRSNLLTGTALRSLVQDERNRKMGAAA